MISSPSKGSFAIALLFTAFNHFQNNNRILYYCNATATHINNNTQQYHNRKLQTQQHDNKGPPPPPKYYYDTSDGKCKLDSPSRPSWLLATQNYTDVQLCCLDNSWNVDGCLAEFNDFETAANDGGDGSGGEATDNNKDNNSDGTIEYYYDTSDGKCKLDSPSRPSWLLTTQNYSDVKLCCNDNSWNVELCLLAGASTNDNNGGSINPNGANLNDNNDISVDNSIPSTIINLTLQGSLILHLPTITSIYQLSSSTLKIVLTKTFIQILQSQGECNKWIIMNDEFEIDLVSIGGISFTWRQRRKMLVAHDEDFDSDGDREKSHNRQLSSGYELIFQMTVPAKCNSLCQQQQDEIALGSITPYNEIKTCFGNSISSGSFGLVFNEIGTSMNLFEAHQEEEPQVTTSVSEGQLTYHYAKQSSTIYTWSPSKQPTDVPTVITLSPTTSNAPTNMYYPDIDNIVCLSLSTSSNQQINVFSSIEECCNFDWMDPATNYDTCISNSQLVASGQTKEPSRQPTQRPTRIPVVKMIYYIDLSLGVCKATSPDDNNNSEQGIATFDTPQECCSHEYITSYDKCISYINTYHSNIDTTNCIWHPNPSKFGYCTYSETYPQSWNTIPDIMLYNTHTSCCLGIFDTMDCYQEYNCNGMKSGPTPMGYVTEAPSTYIPTWSPVNADGSIPEPTSPKQDDSPSLPQAPSDPTANQDASDNSQVLDMTSITTEISDSFENGISGDWPWLTSTSNPWTIYQDDKTDGSYSVRSAIDLSPGETSDLYISINSINGGTLTFDLKSDVKMPYTGCYINIDDESKGGYTYPKSEWDIDKSIPVVSGGVHVIMFRTWAPNYSQGGESGVSGTITLDNVRFMPNLN